MSAFIVYPAIDLRAGQVVRLAQGDPRRQTVYGDDPAAVARQWVQEGAQWIHVVNLDGAFGEQDSANQRGVEAIVAAVKGSGVRIQLGGGMRSLVHIERALTSGVSRVVLGTIAVEQPAVATKALTQFGGDQIAVGLDLENGRVRVRGWVGDSGQSAEQIARGLSGAGLKTVIVTNIARDGLETGPDIELANQVKHTTGLEVIASGGVATAADVRAVATAGLSGVIVGRALYQGNFRLSEVIAS